MESIPVPEIIKRARRNCTLVPMGPPEGVLESDCSTAEVMVSDQWGAIPGFGGRPYYVYYKPTPAELRVLNEGGFIEVAQYGQVMQPFSAAIWES